MNGIEKITARIEADAQAEIEAIKAGSAEKCAALRAENESKARQRYWELVQAGAKENEARVSRTDRNAKLDAKKAVLALKQEQVSAAFDLAKKKIKSLPDADYVNFLARQAANAAATGREELIFSPGDRAAFGAQVVRAANELAAKRGIAAGLSLSDETRPMSGGVILKQGDIEVNSTVDTLLELSRGRLAAQVAEVLFGN